MIRELEHLCYGDGLRQLRLLSLEKIRLLPYCSPPKLERAYKKDRETFSAKMRGNGFNMKECRFRLHTRKKSSTVRVVRLREVAQRSCGCLNLRNVQSQVEWGLDQLGVMEESPAHGSNVEIR